MRTMHEVTSQKQDRLRAGLRPGTRGEGSPPGGGGAAEVPIRRDCRELSGWAESRTRGWRGWVKRVWADLFTSSQWSSPRLVTQENTMTVAF